MLRILVFCCIITTVAVTSCSGQMPITPDEAPGAMEPTPTSTSSLVPTSTSGSSSIVGESEAQEADPLIGMWDPNPAFLGTRELEGILHIEHPCVYLLGHADSDAILIGLPRKQTEYEAASESITVTDRGPVTSGRRIRIVGNHYNMPRPPDACRHDAVFNAWDMYPSEDPFVGMYHQPEDEPSPDYYRIGVLLVEPPCAFLVTRSDWTGSSNRDISYLETEVMLLARNTIRFDPNSKSFKSDDSESVANGDAVVIYPAVGRENRYGKICPGDWELGTDGIIPAEQWWDYLSDAERQYLEQMRRDTAAWFEPTYPQRPCERLSACPTSPTPPPPQQ